MSVSLLRSLANSGVDTIEPEVLPSKTSLTPEAGLRALARIFSRPAVKALASALTTEAALDFWIQHGLVKRTFRSSGNLANLLNAAWDALCEQYRCEYIYKNSLASKMVFYRHRPHTAAFFSEFSVGKSIADIVVVNGTTTAYEVKTQYDSGRRLTTQTADYLRVFDRVYVVAHDSLSCRILPALDTRVGLISVDDSGAMRTQKVAAENRQNVDPAMIFRCLRRAEYLAVIGKETGTVPSAPNGLIGQLCAEEFGRLSPPSAHQHLVRMLRARTTDAQMASFMHALPESLRAAGYATPLSKVERSRLLNRLSSPSFFSLA